MANADRASTTLGAYDGRAGFLVDTNVWIDCADEGSPWHEWALESLQACSARAPLHVNLVIYAELLVVRPDPAALDVVLDVWDTMRTSLPWGCAQLAARAFVLYRSRGGAKSRPMPDFYIGAHAATSNFGVLTRDRSGYASYFPRLSLITPD